MFYEERRYFIHGVSIVTLLTGSDIIRMLSCKGQGRKVSMAA